MSNTRIPSRGSGAPDEVAGAGAEAVRAETEKHRRDTRTTGLPTKGDRASIRRQAYNVKLIIKRRYKNDQKYNDSQSLNSGTKSQEIGTETSHSRQWASNSCRVSAPTLPPVAELCVREFHITHHQHHGHIFIQAGHSKEI